MRAWGRAQHSGGVICWVLLVSPTGDFGVHSVKNGDVV